MGRSSIKQYYCPICHKLTGAENEDTGEHEYIQAARWWEDALWCKDCYNQNVLSVQPFLGGIDELSI